MDRWRSYEERQWVLAARRSAAHCSPFAALRCGGLARAGPRVQTPSNSVSTAARVWCV